MKTYVIEFNNLSINDVHRVGGKNASLGEMIQHLQQEGIRIPDGFAITADAYRDFINYNNIELDIKSVLAELNQENFSNLSEVGRKVRQIILDATLPYNLQITILAAFEELEERVGHDITVAVRSSATAEDLPEASFAGQQESYLNIGSGNILLEACHRCYASLFTDRAIKYRVDQGFDHMEVALSIGVQMMVRSDLACSGVGFTLDPDSGFKNIVVLNGSWGLGENVVKGNVDPDEFVVFKPALKKGKTSILSKRLGAKQQTMVYTDEKTDFASTTQNVNTAIEQSRKFVLSDDEIELLAKWGMIIEEHYNLPMDFEWAKDGQDGKLYMVQARPETVYANKKDEAFAVYKLEEKGTVLAKGSGLGNKITSGIARIIHDPADAGKLKQGDILVTDTTDPDWDPILKKVSAVITNKGGRTSHAAIVARELGAVAVVGATDATNLIEDGQQITVSCAEGQIGFVYDGILKWSKQIIDPKTVQLPRTKVMLILGDPDRAFQYANYPSEGVGLMRMEFIINNAIQIHPMALVKFDELEDEAARKEIEILTCNNKSKPEYFVEKLRQSVGTIAAAFYPREIIVRMSDFKSNEYANLIGGQQFEPKEENPMLGFRGASRYTHEFYKAGFLLECEAMRQVRDDMGLDNIKLMIPFCRTIEEGKKVLQLMAANGLEQGKNGLEIYTMVEIPSNVVLADDFADLFDGFSIGSNDLTQLMLGLDRDNSIISNLFDEKNPAVKKMIMDVIQAAKNNNIPIGLCGQAPSDYPDFAQFLVEQKIGSISFNADALLEGINNIKLAEDKIYAKEESNAG